MRKNIINKLKILGKPKLMKFYQKEVIVYKKNNLNIILLIIIINNGTSRLGTIYL